MPDLATFITARLDAEEQAARAALCTVDGAWEVEPFEGSTPDAVPAATWVSSGDEGVAQVRGDYIAAHIATQDPQATLDRVAALREVMSWCVEVIGDRDLSRYGEMGLLRNDPQAMAVTLAMETLRALASAWRRHPDYDEAWAPDGAEVGV